jgi:hypothetical protein
MNLENALKKAISRTSTDAIIRWVGKDPDRFGQLVEHLLAGDPQIQVRAAWPLSYCVERNPELALPHLSRMVGQLRKPGLHDAVKRSIVRLLQFVDVPKRLQGAVANACFAYVADPAEAPAIRVFSMTVADNLSRSNPDLQRELRLILEDQLPYASAGFVSRAKKILKRYTAT